MTYHVLLFFLTTLLAVASVMAGNLLSSAVLLALVSVGVSLILFDFQAPWAAVFELAVCAGFITILFISAVTLVKRENPSAGESRMRFYAMPLVMAIAAIAAWLYAVPFFEALESWARPGERGNSIGSIIWDMRRVDLVGQISVLAAGVFAIKSILPGGKKQR